MIETMIEEMANGGVEKKEGKQEGLDVKYAPLISHLSPLTSDIPLLLYPAVS